MGMAITFTLVERTPYTLRYLAVSDGGATASPDSGTIPNANGVTPDLRTDADIWHDQPIDTLVNTAVVTQADARELLNGDTLTSVSSVDTHRGRITIIPRTGGSVTGWSADANVVAGFAVINVFGPDLNNAAAYIELRYRHSYDI